MKLHADQPHQLSVTALGNGWIAINGQRHSASVVLSPSGSVLTWNVARPEDLTADHMEQLLLGEASPPELVVLGTGGRLQFLPPAVLRPMIDRRIGVETMDTAAACRTFNILAGEGRRVMAALLITT